MREVSPDPAAGRTAVRLEPWSRERYSPRARQLADAARLATVQTLDLDAYDVGSGRTVQRVVRALEPLTRRPDNTWTARDVGEQVDRAVEVIRDELEQATRMGWARLEAWLQTALAAFERLRSAEPAPVPTAAPVAAAGQGTGVAVPAFAGLSKELAKMLAKPASRPPDDPARLMPTVPDTYAASSDTLVQLLASTRPALGAVLRQAWDGRPLTQPSREAVFALRVRARLYGHNTPTRTAEEVRMTFSDDDEELVVRVRVGDDEVAIRVPQRDGTTVEPFTAAGDVVSVTLSGFPSGLQTVQIRLARRRVTVDVESRRPDRVQVSGCDPATVTLGPDDSATESWLVVNGTISRDPALVERAGVVSLDASYPQILPGSWMAIERLPESGPPTLQVHRVLSVADVSRDDYGVSTVSTQLVLDGPWVDPDKDTFDAIRNSTVFAQSEELELAPLPIDPIEEDICGDRIELDGLYVELQPGRWLVVSGERTDVPDVAGVTAQELAMLAGVEHLVNRDLPGDSAHTVLRLANPLAYCYRRDTVQVHGNVARASHGETRTQVLGSGDASASGQVFELRQRPLTYTPAATATGVESTLQVRVDEVLWHETRSLVESGAIDRHYITVTDDEQRTTVRFGDGVRGARLPTGVENVAAVYRTGIGPEGNLGPARITQLATRPLGVKDVTNPVASTGGAGPEGDDVVRRNAPLGVTALDRLVSVKDHADFALTFAGIGKATASLLSDGRRQLVHVTVAGLDDIPIARESELFSSLLEAFHRLGDPRLPVELAVRELLITVLSAQVSVLPDYAWPLVEADVRSALVERFGFDRRELAQDLLLSEIISTIQQTEGVAYVDVDVLAAVDEPTLLEALATDGGLTDRLGLNTRITVSGARVGGGADPSLRLRPAQLTYFDPLQPARILLTERAR